jgi:hypothetical protein
VSHAHRRQIQYGAEVQGQPATARMITPGPVQQKYVGLRCEAPYDVLQQRAETESQQAGDVRR